MLGRAPRYRAELTGVAFALAGALLVEALVFAGVPVFSPLGWPGLGMAIAAAVAGLRAALGGATVVAAYYVANLAAEHRFADFFAAPSAEVTWFAGIVVLCLAMLMLHSRLERAQREAQSEARLRLLADNLPAIISYVDRDRRFRFRNSAYEEWFGLPARDLVGRTVEEVWGEERYATIRPNLERALRGERLTYEYAFPDREGVERHVQASYVPDFDAAGAVRGVFVLGIDITTLLKAREELRLANQRLERAASFDPLTGCANRTLFNYRLSDAIARSARNGTSLALLYMDIDRFKSINDSLGHATGDAVLRQFAARLRECVRETDTVARLGGDEFVVLLDAVKDEDNARRVAGKILAATAMPARADGDETRVTTSIGIAMRNGESDPAVLMKRADRALYEAKAAGRNTYRLG